MCNCGKNGIKIENQKVLTHDSEWGWELVEDAIFCPFCGENLQPERSKREDQEYWEAEEYDGNRPWHFKVFRNEEMAKKWVNENPEIRKCRKLILDAVL